MSGEYKEELPFSGGDLIVTKDGWKISYYFRGLDMRYNGTFFTIPSSEVNEYIQAYKANWSKFEELKKLGDSVQGELRVEGQKSMNINVGGYFEGICITSYNLPLKTEKEINQMINALEWAKDQSSKIINMLKAI